MSSVRWRAITGPHERSSARDDCFSERRSGLAGDGPYGYEKRIWLPCGSGARDAEARSSRRRSIRFSRTPKGEDMDQDRFWLTDAQFSKIEPHLPTDTRGKARVDDRRVISGIVHVLKSGGRWIDAPCEYGPKKTLYNRYVRWAEKGVWIDLFHALAQAGGPPTQVLIDSSAVKAHRSAAGGKGGRKIRRSVVRAEA